MSYSKRHGTELVSRRIRYRCGGGPQQFGARCSHSQFDSTTYIAAALVSLHVHMMIDPESRTSYVSVVKDTRIVLDLFSEQYKYRVVGNGV